MDFGGYRSPDDCLVSKTYCHIANQSISSGTGLSGTLILLLALHCVKFLRAHSFFEVFWGWTPFIAFSKSPAEVGCANLADFEARFFFKLKERRVFFGGGLFSFSSFISNAHEYKRGSFVFHQLTHCADRKMAEKRVISGFYRRRPQNQRFVTILLDQILTATRTKQLKHGSVVFYRIYPHVSWAIEHSAPPRVLFCPLDRKLVWINLIEHSDPCFNYYIDVRTETAGRWMTWKDPKRNVALALDQYFQMK